MAGTRRTPPRRSRSSARSKESADSGELITSEDVRTGLITGATFFAQPVQYVVRDGLALFEGDIVLGTVEEMDQKTEELRGVIRGSSSPACSAPVLSFAGRTAWFRSPSTPRFPIRLG